MDPIVLVAGVLGALVHVGFTAILLRAAAAIVVKQRLSFSEASPTALLMCVCSGVIALGGWMIAGSRRRRSPVPRPSPCRRSSVRGS